MKPTAWSSRSTLTWQADSHSGQLGSPVYCPARLSLDGIEVQIPGPPSLQLRRRLPLWGDTAVWLLVSLAPCLTKPLAPQQTPMLSTVGL